MNNGAILPTSAASSLICLDQVTGSKTPEVPEMTVKIV